MLVGKCARFCCFFLVFSVVLCEANSNETTVALSASPSVIQPSMYTSVMSSEINPTASTQSDLSLQSKTLTTAVAAQKTTTVPPSTEKKKLEDYVIIIIATCVAVVVVIIIVALVICIFRRRRIQRLERERNLSYNNMNYESTVKFKMNENGERAQPAGEQNLSPKKSNNNRRGEYEVVDLPNDGNRGQRKYENVTPQKSKEDNRSPAPGRPYENVTPAASTSQEKSKSPSGQYEEFVVSSPLKSDDQKRNKYYENVDLQN